MPLAMLPDRLGTTPTALLRPPLALTYERVCGHVTEPENPVRDQFSSPRFYEALRHSLWLGLR